MSVGPISGPVQRPSPDRDIDELLRRVEILERIPSASGWKFDTDNEGGWGYLQFNDDFDLDLLPDPLAAGGTWGGVIEEASGSGLLIGSTSYLDLKSLGDVAIEAADNSISLIADQYIRFFLDGTFFLVENATSTQRLTVGANGAMTLHLSTGNTLNVLNDAGSAIFRVDEDGDLHGLTGKALTFDL